MVSSSRPSSPRNTQASTPRRANTPAITGAIRGSAQPIAWASGWAGLASGPRKLKVVPMPSSRRGTAACRSAGWKAAAKQNVMPASSATCGHPVGGQVEPDAERLEHVGGAGLRGGRPVAVLDDRRAGAGGHDRGHRGDVDRHRPVAAGADHVEQPARDRDRRACGVHRVDQARDLVDRLALGAQRHREAGDLGGRRLAGEDLAHRPGGLLRGQVGAGDQRAEDLGPGVDGSTAPESRGHARRAAARPRPRRAGSGRSGAARRPRRATRWPARRPGGGRSAPAAAGTGRSRP